MKDRKYSADTPYTLEQILLTLNNSEQAKINEKQ